MSIKRGRPGSPAARSGKAVGPDYPDANFNNAFNMGIDSEYGSEAHGDKSLVSPTANTIEGMGLPLHHDYSEYWEGK